MNKKYSDLAGKVVCCFGWVNDLKGVSRRKVKSLHTNIKILRELNESKNCEF